MSKICVINDISGYGRCSATLQLALLSAFGDIVSVAPTAYLSNHTAYDNVYRLDMRDALKKTFDTWDKNGFRFNAILTGYIGDSDSILDIKEYISNLKLDQENCITMVDPVLGDNGRLYNGLDNNHIENMKKLVTVADAITPNLTEACMITGIDYEDLRLKLGILKFDGAYPNDDDEKKLKAKENLKVISDKIINILRPLLDKIVYKRTQVTLITGIEIYNSIVTILDVYNGDTKTRQTTCNFVPKLENRPGTGDLFDALFLTLSLKGYNFIDCLKISTNFISKALKFTIDNKFPKNEGVCIEPLLVGSINNIIKNTKKVKKETK